MKFAVRLAAVTAIAVPLMIGVSTPAHASTISQCTDKYQVGATSYIQDEFSNNIASVKQYWSPMCAQNFAYLYVWQSFRSTHSKWTIDVSEVYHDSSGNWTFEGENFVSDTTGSDFWSHGYSGGGKCTTAYGALQWNESEWIPSAETDVRCG